MHGVFIVIAMLALLVGIAGAVMGTGTSGLGALGAAGVCMLFAIYIRVDEHAKALLQKIDATGKPSSETHAATAMGIRLLKCPSCGHHQTPGGASCEKCNGPMRGAARA